MDGKNLKNEAGVSTSRLYMWRAVFAIAHADRIVTIEETEQLGHYLHFENFSSGQQELLIKDIMKPQDPEKMFLQISLPEDRNDFFRFAEEVAGSDADYCKEEQKVINKLKALN